MPIILGRPFLATAEAEINVQVATLSFYICRERVEICFPPPIPTPAPATFSPPPVPLPTAPPNDFISIGVLDGDRGPAMWPTRYDTSAPISTSLGIPSAHTREVLDPTTPFYTFPGAPPEPPLSTIWR